MNISHDRVNRLLLRESYEPKDLFGEAKKLINLAGGTALTTEIGFGQNIFQPAHTPFYYFPIRNHVHIFLKNL